MEYLLSYLMLRDNSSGVPEQYPHQDVFNYSADFLLRWKDKKQNSKSQNQFAPYFDVKKRFTNLSIEQYQKPPYQLQSRKILESKDFGSYIDLRAFETETHQISRSLQQKNVLQRVRERQVAKFQLQKLEKQRSKQYQNLLNQEIPLISTLAEDKQELNLGSQLNASEESKQEQQQEGQIKIEQDVDENSQTNIQNVENIEIAKEQQQQQT